MKTIVTDRPGDAPVLWQWMARTANVPWSSDQRIIGLIDGQGAILAGAAFQMFFPGGCWVHLALAHPHAATPEFIHAGFDYAFNRAQLDLVLGQTPAYNTRALRLNRRLGFVPFLDTGSVVLQRLNREDCRFLQDPAAHTQALTEDANNGRRRRHSSST